MAAEFSPEPNVHLAIAVLKFPNYFVINDVRGNWSAGSLLPSACHSSSNRSLIYVHWTDAYLQHDVQVNYILKCLERMQTEIIRAIEIKEEPTRQLNRYLGM